MRRTSGFCVTKIQNSETDQWWKMAETIYEEYPQSIPDSLGPLLEKSLNENEVFVSAAELKEIQAWAIGTAGWRPDPPYAPMVFTKGGI
jgi:hypothetical protein